jgi:hypothetical protein
MQNRTKLLASLPIVSALALGACGGSSDSPPPATGTLRVAITDAPACGYDAVHVTVTRVRIHRSETATDEDGEWRDLAVSPPRRLNLLDLQNGVLADLGQLELDAGRYTQLRLVLDTAADSNTVTPSGGAETSLRTPSAQQSGLKLKHAFDVAAGQTVDLVLDFDACRSIVKAGNGDNYLLKPVLTAIPVVTSGTITGSLGSAGSGAVVSAQGVDSQGLPVVMKSTTADATGTFKLEPVKATATSYQVVIQQTGAATHVVTGVPVAAATTTTLPSVTLTPSVMRAVSGRVTVTPQAPAAVRALQTVADGITVELGHDAVESGGTWQIAVPLAAPRVAPWSPSPTFANGANAAKYRLEARSDGMPSRFLDVDVAAGNVVVDVALP